MHQRHGGWNRYGCRLAYELRDQRLNYRSWAEEHSRPLRMETIADHAGMFGPPVPIIAFDNADGMMTDLYADGHTVTHPVTDTL